MSRIIGTLIVILLFCSFLSKVAYSEEGKLAAVRAEGASINPDKEAAQKEAINVALRKAIWGKVDEITRLSLKEKGKAERAFKDDLDSYVAKYDVIPTGEKQGRVVLDVYVMADKLVDKLIEIGFTANLIYKPRILVVIDENEEGKRAKKRILTTQITNKLVENGFKTVMPKSAREARRMLTKIEESEEAVAELGKKHNCDIIVTGESDVEVIQINLGPYKKSWSATASIEAIRCDNEDVLFSQELSGASPALTKAKGSQRAYERMVNDTPKNATFSPGERLLRGLLRDWPIEGVSGKTLPSPDPNASKPPQLVLFAPNDKTVTTEASIRLRGEAVDDVSVAGVKILVNGMDVALTKDIHLVRNRHRFRDIDIQPTEGADSQIQGAGAYQFSRPVSLREGENTIKIIALDSDNNKAEASRTVIYQSPKLEQEKQAVKILIYSPTDEEVSESEAIQLRGEVVSEYEIAHVYIRVNGEELPVERDIHLVKIDARTKEQNNYHIDNSIPLSQKRNLIHISASTTSGLKAEKYLTVIRRENAQTSAVQLAIYEPLDKSETSEDNAKIRGEVLSEEGITDVTISVNGEPLLTKRDLKIKPVSSNAKFRKATYNINQNAMLNVGENRIKIVAETNSGQTAETELSVTRISKTEEKALQILVESPSDGHIVAKASVHLMGKILGSEPVTNIEISVNGAPIPRERDINIVKMQREQRDITITKVESAGRESVETPIDKSIPLAPGDNVIKIECSAKSGLKTAKSLTISRTVSTEPQDTEIQQEVANKYAVIIGIGNYEDDDIPDLRYSRKDAESLYALITEPQVGGFPKENVRLLVDEQATLKAIKSTIGSWLARIVKPQDMVLLFYSGHGGVDSDPSGEESDGLNKYIISYDAELSDLYSTALLNSELSIMLDRVRSNQFIFLIDCCHSGGATSGVSEIKTLSTIKADIYKQLASQGRVVISASLPEQVSFEVSRLGHGIFTYHLLDGLRGKADIDQNLLVSLMETYFYLIKEVDKTARSLGARQIPTFKGNIAGDIILTKSKNTDF